MPQYDCIKAFSETDFAEGLKAILVPVLVLHGEDDQIVPIDHSARHAVSCSSRAGGRPIPTCRTAWPRPIPRSSTPISSPSSGAAGGGALVLAAGLLAAGTIVLTATLLLVRHLQMSEIERP